MRRRVLTRLSTRRPPAAGPNAKRYEVSSSFRKDSLRTKLVLVFYQPRTLGRISLSELLSVTEMTPQAREELGADDGPCPHRVPEPDRCGGSSLLQLGFRPRPSISRPPGSRREAGVPPDVRPPPSAVSPAGEWPRVPRPRPRRPAGETPAAVCAGPAPAEMRRTGPRRPRGADTVSASYRQSPNLPTG